LTGTVKVFSPFQVTTSPMVLEAKKD